MRGKAPPARPVLVVDDDPDTTGALVDLLEDAGFEGVGAADGAEALKVLFSGVTPCLIVFDLEMPKMDGEAFCAACDANPKFASIPRVLVSGSREAAQAAQRCKAAGFLTKPLDPDKLLRQIEALVGANPARSSRFG